MNLTIILLILLQQNIVQVFMILIKFYLHVKIDRLLNLVESIKTPIINT
jgi:hypothetical protein